jgi:hypothetical protein
MDSASMSNKPRNFLLNAKVGLEGIDSVCNSIEEILSN